MVCIAGCFINVSFKCSVITSSHHTIFHYTCNVTESCCGTAGLVNIQSANVIFPPHGVYLIKRLLKCDDRVYCNYPCSMLIFRLPHSLSKVQCKPKPILHYIVIMYQLYCSPSISNFFPKRANINLLSFFFESPYINLSIHISVSCTIPYFEFICCSSFCTLHQF